MKLVREGEVIHCRAALGPKGEWRDLASIEFGADPVESIRLVADTGGPPLPVHADLTEFSVTAARLPFGPPAEPPDPGTPWPLIAGGVAAAAFGLAGFVLWRRRNESA